MQQRILFISGNYFPEPTGIGKYNMEMTEWMADNGFDVTVISTYPYYPFWKIQDPYANKHNWYTKEDLSTAKGNSITIYRCPHYVPKKPTAIRRMVLDFSFSLSAFFQVLTLLGVKRFNYVITVIPPLPLGLLSVLYKKMRKTKFLYHIQDLQIEAARDLKMITSPRTIRTLFRIEKYILKHADTISSISEGMIKNIKLKTTKPVVFFPNWADLSLFYPIEDKAALKEEAGFLSTDVIIMYSGSIGEKQGLEAILHAAAQHRNDHSKFIICGSGPYTEQLQLMATEMQLGNVKFFPLQPLEMFNRFLNMADLHLIIQKANASDLVMPSKLTNILAVGGLALITANEGTALFNLIEKYKMGILVNAEDPEALINGINNALSDAPEDIKSNALTYAQKHLSLDEVMKNYFSQSK